MELVSSFEAHWSRTEQPITIENSIRFCYKFGSALLPFGYTSYHQSILIEKYHIKPGPRTFKLPYFFRIQAAACKFSPLISRPIFEHINLRGKNSGLMRLLIGAGGFYSKKYGNFKWWCLLFRWPKCW